MYFFAVIFLSFKDHVLWVGELIYLEKIQNVSGVLLL